MNWSKRSNGWALIVFVMVVTGAGMKFLFAFAFQDVDKHIAMAFIFLIGGIILLVVPAYFLGMLVDKLKKENSNISQHKRQAPLRGIEPDIADPTKHNILVDENKMSDKKQENEMVDKVASDEIITKPVVEPKTINLHYGDTLPSDQMNVSDNLISKSENLKPLVTIETDAFYAQAWDEINDQNKEPVKALWARSFADAQGNESLAKANYLKLRVEQLSKEYEQNIRMEKERQIELLRQQAALEEMEANKHETERDDNFIAYDNETVLDAATNLMWAAKDNGMDINWNNAKSYCENYRGGGYTDWRMPTSDELESLYDITKENRTDLNPRRVHLTKLIILSNVWLWSEATDKTEAACFCFSFNKWEWEWRSKLGSDWLRVLPVRSVK